MKWTATVYEEEYVPYDEKSVKLERKEHTFECPFECGQDAYYVYRERRLFSKDRWVVRKSRIIGIWATISFGVILDNDERISECLFDRLFTNKEEAVDFCIKKNQGLKIKIYNE